jgi:signal transduction histidine kinase
MLAFSLRSISRVLAIDLLVIAIGVLGVYRLSEKAGFPARIEKRGGALVIRSERAPLLKSGDTLVAIEGQPVASLDEIEFLCDQDSIGETIPVTLIQNGQTFSIPISLIQDYSRPKIIVESFAALIFFLTGIAVVILQKNDNAARIFHHLSISIAALIVLTTGRFTIAPFGMGYALEIIFQACYVLVPALFLHFTLIFPHDKLCSKKTFLVPVYSIAGMLALWSAMTFLRVAYPSVHLNHYEAYGVGNYAILVFFAATFIVGFANLLHSYRVASEEFERRKLRWIFFGIVFGTSAYLLLFLIPKLLVGKNVDEELAIAISVIAPISFAIAIIRFKVFDIDLFFRRSTVYTLAISLLLAIYLGIVALFTQVVLAMGLPAVLPNIIGAILIALLFEPLRRQIQTYVNKKFFRVSYDFHGAQRSIIERIKFVHAKQALADLVIESMYALIPVTKIGFFVVETPSDRLKLLAHRNFDLLERRNIQLRTNDLKTGLELPVALSDIIEPGIAFEPADREVFSRWGMALVLPMLSPDRKMLGFLVLGYKRSGARFFIEDISLLTSISTQAGLALERLNVEYALMLEQAESERLAELSAMKSYFVSSVSHDLKTPLTSIRLFAELIKDHEDLPRQKAIEYLSIIEDESDRLARLITNVLDFAKIEKGTKEYAFKRRDLNEIAHDVIRSMNYQITSHGFQFQSVFSAEPLLIHADSDALFDAITNLISNAMKYSPPERKRITITTASENSFAILAVRDEGYGIAPNEREHIFESFYRIDDPMMKSAGGAGIGLSIVKHTMDAHRGKAEVTSEVGKGSIFVLYFPRMN